MIRSPQVYRVDRGMDSHSWLTVLVVEAESRLWSSEGVEALAYLTGSRRLTLGTIRTARLGYSPGVRLATNDGRTYPARGIVIPWFDGDRLALLKIRQPEGD